MVLTTAISLAVGLAFGAAQAEILAMMNYESKTKESLKTLKLGGEQKRREGIAVVDVDPNSKAFGKILMDIPLPPDLLAHHIFYEKTMGKAYITTLGKSLVYVIDMKKYPYRLKRIDAPACKVGEDIVFSDDNKTWYLTCMGSDNVIVGDAVADTLEDFAPGFKDSVLFRQTLTPWDLEQDFGLTEGNIFQGELTFDQLLFNRPVPGYADYSTPIEGLYLLGSSAHPGGGVMAAPGANAAAEILRRAGKSTRKARRERHWA